MATYSNLHGSLRLYDSTATPFYVEVLFDEGNLTAPEGRPRTEENIIFHRGRGDTNTHYCSGPDTPITDPQELSFSFRVQNDTTAAARLRDALSEPDQANAMSVDGDAWVTTKGDFSLINGDGSTFSDPAFEDSRKYCVNVEILWTRGGTSIGRKYGAVYFGADQQGLAESEDGVLISVTGMIYGLITVITSFTAGNAS